MSDQTDNIMDSLTAVINGMAEAIQKENEEKSRDLMEALCKQYEELGDDDHYQTLMHLEMMRLADLPAKPFLLKHPEITRWDKFYIKSIYNGLFSHWFQRIICALEGTACSSDKERFVTYCVVKSIVEQTNISLYRTYGDYGDKYKDKDIDLDKRVYWSPLCFKDTDAVKERFRQWWRVVED